jgi:hypothetical protein
MPPGNKLTILWIWIRRNNLDKPFNNHLLYVFDRNSSMRHTFCFYLHTAPFPGLPSVPDRSGGNEKAYPFQIRTRLDEQGDAWEEQHPPLG